MNYFIFIGGGVGVFEGRMRRLKSKTWYLLSSNFKKALRSPWEKAYPYPTPPKQVSASLPSFSFGSFCKALLDFVTITSKHLLPALLEPYVVMSKVKDSYVHWLG
jgi:hypothetical protein